ncbi:MAG TPA: glycosyltransferase [Pyrinomonadaceae bacterium]|nr:glycosyltransferase [Pyrinomonadaceae bacterium]
MKILRIIARLNVGGPAKHVVWLTAGLDNYDCQTLLVSGMVPPGEDDMAYFAEQMGVEPIYLRQMSREISIKDAFTVWKLFRLFLRERPDIVHTHTAKAGTVGRLAGWFYRWATPGTLVGKPRRCHFVHTYHGHIFHSYYGKLKTSVFLAIERTLARLVTDRIIVISDQQRQEINQQFQVGQAHQFNVIPLGLDTQVFANWESRRQQFRDDLNAKADDVLVGIVGRLTEIKNHHLFLKAAALYKQLPQSRRVRFVIIGDGNLRPELMEATRALRLEDDVIFAGTRQDPEYFYPALDVVALTSRNEGTPLTLIEAMLNARPVIATSVGGVVDLLGAIQQEEPGFTICERGIRVNADDADGFAKGLAKLLDDGSLRVQMGERGRQFVEQNYAKERLFKDISELYRELMHQKTEPVTAPMRQRSVC